MGLELQEWTAEFANDIDREKYEMYCGQFKQDWVPFVVDYVHKLSAVQVPLESQQLCYSSNPSLAGAACEAQLHAYRVSGRREVHQRRDQICA
jgi:hypothetical protein